eukprot:3675073-Pyramimonas_sp.AAC.1
MSGMGPAERPNQSVGRLSELLLHCLEQGPKLLIIYPIFAHAELYSPCCCSPPLHAIPFKGAGC